MIDPIQFGRVLEAMERMPEDLAAVRAESEKNRQAMSEAVDQIVARVEELESRFLMGKWTLVGIVVAVGTLTVGVKDVIKHAWGLITG